MFSSYFCSFIIVFQSSDDALGLEASQYLFDIVGKQNLGIEDVKHATWNMTQDQPAHNAWTKPLYDFSTQMSDIIGYPLGMTVSKVDKDYFGQQLSKALKKKICDKSQYDDVCSKCVLSMTYSTEIQKFGKTLPNYDKLKKLYSKKHREEYNTLVEKLNKKNLDKLDPTEQEPKIVEFLKSKTQKLKKAKFAMNDLFENRLNELKTRSAKANNAWNQLNEVDHHYNSKGTEEKKMKKAKEEFSEFIPLFNDYISLVNEKDIETVKAEMTKEFPAFEKDFQSIHDVLIDFPKKMCDFIDAMIKKDDKGAAKSKKSGKGDAKQKSRI